MDKKGPTYIATHRDGPRIVRGAAAPRRVIVFYLPYLLRSLFYPVFRIRMLNVLVIFDVARPFKAETLTYSLTFFNLLSSLCSIVSIVTTKK